MVTDSIAVSYQHCDCKFFLANAFSPNGDGRNDHFGPSFACTYSDYHLQLFNRWGQLIFESHDPTEQWDGSFKGKSVPEGVYVWRLKYQSALEYRAVERRGSVTVLR
jgi:gliding motility-associated-like protein